MQDGAMWELIDLCSVLGRCVRWRKNYPAIHPMHPPNEMRPTVDHRVSCTDIACSCPAIWVLSCVRMREITTEDAREREWDIQWWILIKAKWVCVWSFCCSRKFDFQPNQVRKLFRVFRCIIEPVYGWLLLITMIAALCSFMNKVSYFQSVLGLHWFEVAVR